METSPTNNDHAKWLEEKRQEMITALAALLHERWRKSRYIEEEKLYTPRLKLTKDQNWVNSHGGSTEVDIANTTFKDLPNDWQEENLLSAKVAIEKIEDVLRLVHDNWLDRNDENASEKQKVQYSRLPNSEKRKDIDVLEEAIKIVKENANK